MNGAMDVNYLPESFKVSVMVPGLSSTYITEINVQRICKVARVVNYLHEIYIVSAM